MLFMQGADTSGQYRGGGRRAGCAPDAYLAMRYSTIIARSSVRPASPCSHGSRNAAGCDRGAVDRGTPCSASSPTTPDQQASSVQTSCRGPTVRSPTTWRAAARGLSPGHPPATGGRWPPRGARDWVSMTLIRTLWGRAATCKFDHAATVFDGIGHKFAGDDLGIVDDAGEAPGPQLITHGLARTSDRCRVRPERGDDTHAWGIPTAGRSYTSVGVRAIQVAASSAAVASGALDGRGAAAPWMSARRHASAAPCPPVSARTMSRGRRCRTR